MNTIVNDDGFRDDDWAQGFRKWEDTEQGAGDRHPDAALDVPNSLAGDELADSFASIPMIRVPFPSHVDGRGFTLARRLRLLGYRGRLRACGHILPDQYLMARHCGFDEIEIDRDLARRQPEDLWRPGESWRTRNYQARLRAGKPAPVASVT